MAVPLTELLLLSILVSIGHYTYNVRKRRKFIPKIYEWLCVMSLQRWMTQTQILEEMQRHMGRTLPKKVLADLDVLEERRLVEKKMCTKSQEIMLRLTPAGKMRVGGM